jgi:hypothetical protein
LKLKLMGQFHETDLLSSAPGSGKKVVQERACKGMTVGAAGATVSGRGGGCWSRALVKIVLMVW